MKVLYVFIFVLLSFNIGVAQNYSLSFDGDGDYIEIPDADVLSPLNFTIELWVKQPTLTSGRNTYVSKDRGGTHVEYNFMENAPGIPGSQEGLYSYAGFEFFITDTHPPTNEWSHIAVTFDTDANLMEIFLNGVSLGTKTINDEVLNTNGNLYIGWNPTDPAGNALTGIVDEVRISNVVRYTSDFTPLTSEFEPDSKTVALYHFNEGSGNIVVDFSGNGNDGIVFGATWSKDVPDVTTGVEVSTDSGIPNQYILYNNYPNPFNPTTTISYQLSKSGKVDLSIYNITGQLVDKLVAEHQEAGSYTVIWNASQLGSGVFFYRISVNDFTEVRRAVLLK